MASEIKAIVFDTFGTVVDWRGSIIDDLSGWGAKERVSADWAELVDRWRGRYAGQMDRVRNGELPWTNLDELHFDALQSVFAEMGIPVLDETRMMHVNKVWHRLKGWSDSTSGLYRLKRKFIIGPLSNANIAILVNMAKYADLPWDNIFCAELFQHYKPDPHISSDRAWTRPDDGPPAGSRLGFRRGRHQRPCGQARLLEETYDWARLGFTRGNIHASISLKPKRSA